MAAVGHWSLGTRCFAWMQLPFDLYDIFLWDHVRAGWDWARLTRCPETGWNNTQLDVVYVDGMTLGDRWEGIF